MTAERLQKVLAHRGVTSRRDAETWIRAGRVRVNDRVVTELGVRVDPASDRIEVDGRPIPEEATRFVLLLNKPAGYVTTVKDPHAPRTVMELVKGAPGRVYPVGRLDRETRGALLLTNDGDLAHRLLHPSRGVEKVYLVKAVGRVTDADLKRLARGVELDDGPTAPAKVWGVRRTRRDVQFKIALHEGRKRQVRRMVQFVGGHVIDLVRVAFGPITLGSLDEGSWRRLGTLEVRDLRRGAKRPGPGRRRRPPKGGRR